jgi:phospholipid/cholesterol/gamma-HCH transport system permease protein
VDADLRRDLVPQVIASAFAVLSLAMVSSVIVLVLAYVSVYGMSPWGLVDYTRTVGRVFDPAVTIGFALKTILFGLAVAVIPMAAILETARRVINMSSTVQPGAIRLLSVLVLIEAGSLAVKYI